MNFFFYLVDLVHAITGKFEHQLPGHDGCRHGAVDGGCLEGGRVGVGEAGGGVGPTPQGGVGVGGCDYDPVHGSAAGSAGGSEGF